jgi:hypothetical protein
VALAIESSSDSAPKFPPVIARVATSPRPEAASDQLGPYFALGVWCCGCAAVLLAWCVRWRRTAGIVRAAEPLTEGREVETLRRLQGQIEDFILERLHI